MSAKRCLQCFPPLKKSELVEHYNQNFGSKVKHFRTGKETSKKRMFLSPITDSEIEFNQLSKAQS